MELDTGEVIAGFALLVAFLGLLLNAAKGNRDAHGETDERARLQERRDTNLERDAKDTKAAVGRIEAALASSTADLRGRLEKTDAKLTAQLDRLGDKLDTTNQRLARAEARMTAIEGRQDRAENLVMDLMNVQGTRDEMDAKEERERNAREKGGQ